MLTSPRTVREISRSSIPAERARLVSFPNVPPERSVEQLTPRHTWRPWTSFRLGRGVFFFGSLFTSQIPNRGAHRWASYHPVRFAGVRLSSRRHVASGHRT